jgi:tRNA modification GTPase
MSFNTDDTICAIATAPGGGARGVVRVSGRSAVQIAARLFEPSDATAVDRVTSASVVSGHARVEVGSSSRRLPCDLFVWPTNRSYTREPVAEFHTIGSTPVLSSMLNALCAAGARLAGPGEFTLRAFLAGRLDLTQAEAVLGVIDSRGCEDLATSLSQLAGGLARPLDEARDELLQLLAELEAGLDFVDEDIEFISADDLRKRLDSVGALLETVGERMSSRHISADRMQVVLVGPPNAGKSSLFNAMVERFGRDFGSCLKTITSAIVAPVSGTTRDYLTATISLDGVHCDLVDTAGIDNERNDDCQPDVAPRMSSRSIEETAQSLTDERRQSAAIRVYCIEAELAAGSGWKHLSRSSSEIAGADLVAFTKLDEGTSCVGATAIGDIPVVHTSSRTGEGLGDLCNKLTKLLSSAKTAGRGQVVAATADRCRESVRSARAALVRAVDLVMNRGGNELVAVELRVALEDIGRVVGAVYTNDLLDRIFGTFCIGK